MIGVKVFQSSQPISYTFYLFICCLFISIACEQKPEVETETKEKPPVLKKELHLSP